MPAQWKGFWDGTGGQWARGDLKGKYAGVLFLLVLQVVVKKLLLLTP